MTFIAGVVGRPASAAGISAGLFSRSGRELSAWKSLQPSPDVSLGVSLTALLPEDIYDRQPLAGSRYMLVGDIRIDNRDELATKLGLNAAEVSRLADSDLFLRAWEAWQEDATSRVIGGFAVAIWDKQERELCLVRDHCGERPVYYIGSPAMLAFASLPLALRGIPGVDTSIDEQYLLHYLVYGPESSAETCFKNIKLLRSGHMLVYRDGHTKIRRYWHPLDTPAIRLPSNEAYAEALLERFDAAVLARLRSNGKAGSHLSGGMDSSSVTASAARLMESERLTAFTAVPQKDFSETDRHGSFGDEGPLAAQVAAMYPNIDHVLVEPSNMDLFRVIEETGGLTGSPIFNPLNQMWLNAIQEESQRRGIKVILQGVCGNATVSFDGRVALSDLFKAGQWWKLFRTVRTLRSGGYTSWRGGAYWAAGSMLPLILRKWLSQEVRGLSLARSPIRPDHVREHDFGNRVVQLFYGHDKSSEAFRRSLFDFYDAGMHNAAATLGWEISLRDPMQDKRIFEFCYAIPIEQYLAEGQTRSLVRRSMRDRLPAELLSRRGRGRQAADWYLTLGKRRQEMAAELKLIAQSPMACRLLDIQRLQTLLETWPTSGYEEPAVIESWNLALTRGLSIGNFIRNADRA